MYVTFKPADSKGVIYSDPPGTLAQAALGLCYRVVEIRIGAERVMMVVDFCMTSKAKTETSRGGG